MENSAKKLEALAHILGEIMVPTKLTNTISVPIMAVQKGMMEVAEELRRKAEPAKTGAGSAEHEEART